MSYENKKDHRDFSRSNDRPNRPIINAVHYDTDSSDDDNADVGVAVWNWTSKSKPFVCLNLKPASKSRQDEMRFTFDVAKCDRIFDYLLQEKQIKLSSNHVIPSPKQLRSMHIANGIIHFLMLLMIAMSFVVRFNRPSMKED